MRIHLKCGLENELVSIKIPEFAIFRFSWSPIWPAMKGSFCDGPVGEEPHIYQRPPDICKDPYLQDAENFTQGQT